MNNVLCINFIVDNCTKNKFMNYLFLSANNIDVIIYVWREIYVSKENG